MKLFSIIFSFYLTGCLFGQKKYYTFDLTVDLLEGSSLSENETKMFTTKEYYFDNDYLLSFSKIGKEYQVGEFEKDYRDVFIVENKTNRTFSQDIGVGIQLFSNQTNSLFLNQVPQPTGNSKFINGIKCLEYTCPTEGHFEVRDKYFYIDEALPFVNYRHFQCRFPGFVKESVVMYGREPIALVANIHEIEYDSTFFRFTQNLQKQYPQWPDFDNIKVQSNCELTDAMKNKVVDVLVGRTQLNSSDNIELKRENRPIVVKNASEIMYYNSHEKLFYKVTDRGREISKISINSDVDRIYSTDMMFNQFYENDTLYKFDHENNLEEKVYYDKIEKIQSVFDLKYKLISKKKYNENDFLISDQKLSLDGKPIRNYEFVYDDHNLKKKITKQFETNGLEKEERIIEFDYFENQLPKTRREDSEIIHFNYLLKDHPVFDSLFVVESDKYDVKQSITLFVFDKNENLINRNIYESDYTFTDEFLYDEASCENLDDFLKDDFDLLNYIVLDYYYNEFQLVKLKRYNARNNINTKITYGKYKFLVHDLSVKDCVVTPTVFINGVDAFFENENYVYYKLYLTENIHLKVDPQYTNINEVLNDLDSNYRGCSLESLYRNEILH